MCNFICDEEFNRSVFYIGDNSTLIPGNEKHKQNKYFCHDLHGPILLQQMLIDSLESDIFVNMTLRKKLEKNPADELHLVLLNNTAATNDIIYVKYDFCLDFDIKIFKKRMKKIFDTDILPIDILGLRKYSGDENLLLYCKITDGFFRDWYLCTFDNCIKVVKFFDETCPTINSRPYFDCNKENCKCPDFIGRIITNTCNVENYEFPYNANVNSYLLV